MLTRRVAAPLVSQVRVSGRRFPGKPLADYSGRFSHSPIHFNAAGYLGMRPVLKSSLSLPPGSKKCVPSVGVIEKDGSRRVFRRRNGEELDGEMRSVPYCYVCVRQRLTHS